VGGWYDEQLQATGQGPITWEIVPGQGTLPPGLEIESDGRIFGEPLPTGQAIREFSFVVRARNAGGYVDRRFSIFVEHPPVIRTTSISEATANTLYQMQLDSMGPGVTWRLESGDLPQGVIITSGGLIYGIPRETGWFTFEVSATNEAGTSRRSFELFVMWHDPVRHLNAWWPFYVADMERIDVSHWHGWIWQDAMMRGVDVWNSNPQVGVSVYLTPESSNRVFMYRWHDDYNYRDTLGMLTTERFVGTVHFHSFTVSLFTEAINELVGDRGDAVLSNYITAIMAHEIGHIFGLRDAPDSVGGNPFGGSPNASLMNWTRNRNLVFFPQPFDIESINLIPRRHQ